MVKLQFRCGCGGINYELNDWICHIKHRGWLRAIRHFLLTRIELS